MVLSRRRVKHNTEPKAHKAQLIDMPLDVLTIEVRALRESITLNVQ
jgi:hypothetical protein